MLNARHSFARLWKRLVAALSLVMAAALAPAAVSAPAGGAGAAGSRFGNGATVASAANALATNIAGLIEGDQHQLPPATSTDGAAGKPWALAASQEIAAVLRPEAPSPRPTVRAVPRSYAARSGPTRAPPAA